MIPERHAEVSYPPSCVCVSLCTSVLDILSGEQDHPSRVISASLYEITCRDLLNTLFITDHKSLNDVCGRVIVHLLEDLVVREHGGLENGGVTGGWKLRVEPDGRLLKSISPPLLPAPHLLKSTRENILSANVFRQVRHGVMVIY